MWHSKKFIIPIVVAAVLLLIFGTLGGVALAQTSTTADNTTPGKTLLGRMATILGIDQTKVEDAYSQASKEMQQDRLDTYLNNLVTQGKITQQQADEYKQWIQSKPDVPLNGGIGGFGKFGRMMGGRGWCGPGFYQQPAATN